MQGLLKQGWWALLIGGIALVVFGVLALVWPMADVAGFGTVLCRIDSDRWRVHRRWRAYALGIGQTIGGSWLLLGILGVVAGAIGLLAPAAAAAVMVVLLAAYAIATGILMIWMGVKLRKEITGEWLLILAGAVSVIFGALIM